MFTGIVEGMGVVASLVEQGSGARLTVAAPKIAAGVRIGDSIAVGGACLTVVEVDTRGFVFEAVRETLERTTLGELRTGSRVNLERAMRADARFDGHIVQGHVDETGRMRERRGHSGDVQLFIACSPDFAACLIEKGSVAIDGVSLTIVGVSDDGFDVALIPHTLSYTTLGLLRGGERVNLEADVLGKYVKRYLERVLPRQAS